MTRAMPQKRWRILAKRIWLTHRQDLLKGAEKIYCTRSRRSSIRIFCNIISFHTDSRPWDCSSFDLINIASFCFASFLLCQALRFCSSFLFLSVCMLAFFFAWDTERFPKINNLIIKKIISIILLVRQSRVFYSSIIRSIPTGQRWIVHSVALSFFFLNKSVHFGWGTELPEARRSLCTGNDSK